MTEEDLAFATLRAVRSEVASDLAEQLVSHCYSIQKKRQFDQDRSISSQMMERLIDDYVDSLVAQEAEGAPA